MSKIPAESVLTIIQRNKGGIKYTKLIDICHAQKIINADDVLTQMQNDGIIKCLTYYWDIGKDLREELYFIYTM